jgi:hypothetical protein
MLGPGIRGPWKSGVVEVKLREETWHMNLWGDELECIHDQKHLGQGSEMEVLHREANHSCLLEGFDITSGTLACSSVRDVIDTVVAQEQYCIV